MKIYLVSQGCYSDYRIIAAFSTEEKAKAYVKHLGDSDDEDILEFDVDSETFQNPRGLNRFTLQMKRDGSLVYGVTDRGSVKEEKPQGPKWEPLAKVWVDENSECYMRFEVEAKDKEHALKIANEKRTELISADIWLHTYKRTIDSIERLKKFEQEGNQK